MMRMHLFSILALFICWITIVNAAVANVNWATYISDNVGDGGAYTSAMDSNGVIYVSIFTDGSGHFLPKTTGTSFLNPCASGTQGAICRIYADGTLHWCTYGSAPYMNLYIDFDGGVLVHDTRIVSGRCPTSYLNLFITSDALDNTYDSATDQILYKMTTSGVLQYGTYIKGGYMGAQCVVVAGENCWATLSSTPNVAVGDNFNSAGVLLICLPMGGGSRYVKFSGSWGIGPPSVRLNSVFVFGDYIYAAGKCDSAVSPTLYNSYSTHYGSGLCPCMICWSLIDGSLVFKSIMFKGNGADSATGDLNNYISFAVSGDDGSWIRGVTSSYVNGFPTPNGFRTVQQNGDLYLFSIRHYINAPCGQGGFTVQWCQEFGTYIGGSTDDTGGAGGLFSTQFPHVIYATSYYTTPSGRSGDPIINSPFPSINWVNTDQHALYRILVDHCGIPTLDWSFPPMGSNGFYFNVFPVNQGCLTLIGGGIQGSDTVFAWPGVKPIITQSNFVGPYSGLLKILQSDDSRCSSSWNLQPALPCNPCHTSKFAQFNPTCQCPVGFIVNFTLPGNVVNASFSGCMSCPVGTYKFNDTLCIVCPPGSYYTGPSYLSCTLTPTGTYQDQSGYSNYTFCPAGTSQASLGATSLATCMPCSLGYFSPNAGAAQCLPCCAGYWSATLRATECVPCGVGYYNSNSGSQSLLACIKCPIFGETSPQGSPSVGNCSCPPFAVYDGGGTFCSCDVGAGAFSTTPLSCFPCAANAYKATVSNGPCTPCPSGSFVLSPPGLNFTDCSCGGNRVITDPVSGNCACGPGYGLSGGSCVACSAFTYKVEAADGPCTQCPLLSSVPTALLPGKAPTDCVCFSNSVFNPNPSIFACECNAGFGFQGASAQSPCTPCGAGSYKSSQGNFLCTPCPTFSKIILTSTAVSISECVCQNNKYMKDGACVDCPNGGNCTSGFLFASNGFWRPNVTYLEFAACVPPGACTGGYVINSSARDVVVEGNN
jgi:hypothetical protein